MSINEHDVGRSVDEVLRILRAFRTGALCPADWAPGKATLTSEDDWLEKVFPDLAGPELESLAEEAEKVTFADGDTIVAEGDTADRFFVIAQGEVRVTRRTPEGEEIELTTLGPGQFFGEIGLLAETRRTATVRAIEQRRVARPELAGVPEDAGEGGSQRARFLGDHSGAARRNTVSAACVLYVDDETVDDVVGAERGILILAKDDCDNCAAYEAEIRGLQEQGMLGDLVLGKIVLTRPGARASSARIRGSAASTFSPTRCSTRAVSESTDLRPRGAPTCWSALRTLGLSSSGTVSTAPGGRTNRAGIVRIDRLWAEPG